MRNSISNMHKVINLIIYAEDEDSAVSKADSMLEDLCGEEKTYDWYSRFTEESRNTTSGIGRWGDLPLVTLVI